MEENTSWYIVLEKTRGEERTRFDEESVPYQFNAGYILEYWTPESDQPKDQEKIAVTYPWMRGLRLECPKKSVSQLTNSEADLLNAVGSREERLGIYKDKRRLKEAKAFKSGCKVFVKLEIQNQNKELPGVIRWIGRLPVIRDFTKDEIHYTLFGVELVGEESEGCGESDGTYREKRYFTCPSGRGLFVAIDRLRPRQDQEENAARLAELAASLDEERKAREETERRLYTSEQRTHEHELSLAAERQAHQETQRRLRSNEQRLREVEALLTRERQAQQRRSNELEASLARERQAQQRSNEMATSLAAERQAHQETERRLESSEERSQELDNTLTTVRQAFEDYRRSVESARDWVVRRDDIRLSDKEIGTGGWGEVKEGTFRGCKVAVKKIHQLILCDHNRRLFEREMNMASRCRHPCLLQFIGATNDDQSPLFVTELLDSSLRAVLQERPLELAEIMTIALDVAKGLNYLHLSHPTPIIHRDISSANVLLWHHVNGWRAKVSDYGTANFLQQSMTTCPGAVAYSAPEAQTSRQSPKLDVYSFGALLCEMNIREMPDPDRRDEQVAMVTSTLFRILIKRCLKQNPEDRPSMAEIIDTLESSSQ